MRRRPGGFTSPGRKMKGKGPPRNGTFRGDADRLGTSRIVKLVQGQQGSGY